ncbi:MAG: hypothetical protein H6631_09170 [Anaerolineaceae bacterium]|nr:hypothetical protein [Anaerolineaceae bacterium]
MPDQTDLQKLIHHHRRRLAKLQEQQAQFGLYTPPHILTEIEDIEQELDRLARQQQAGPAAPDDDFLAAAYRLLAQQPSDAVPDVAPLPPGSRLPLAANPLFVGRQADLMSLARSLTGDRPAVISQAALTGLGGIGKTQLAVEYAHRYGQYFAGGVFWLNFTQAETIPAEIAVCGGPAGLGLYPDQTGLALPDQVALVRSAWQSPLPRLLIFDNCEDEALLAHYRPTSGGGRILVTSRRSRWSRALGVTTVKLATLARADSIALLLKFRPDLVGGRGAGAGGREVSPPQDKDGQGSRLSRPARILPPPSLPPSTSSGRSRLGGGANTSPPAGGTEGGQIWANPTSPPLKELGGPPAPDPQPPIPDPLDALASELGDLPLALHLAGSFLETYQHAAFGTPVASRSNCAGPVDRPPWNATTAP